MGESDVRNQHVKEHLHAKDEAVAGLMATPKMFYIKQKIWVRYLQHSQPFDIKCHHGITATCEMFHTKPI